jgi:hypothetical protein
VVCTMRVQLLRNSMEYGNGIQRFNSARPPSGYEPLVSTEASPQGCARFESHRECHIIKDLLSRHAPYETSFECRAGAAARWRPA